MKNVIIYSRVATKESTLSLEFQEEKLKNYCKQHNYNIIKSYKEVYSGTSFDRPEWLKMRAFIETNDNSIQSILVLRYDRVCRNASLVLTEMERLNKLGISIEYIEQQNDDNNEAFFKRLLLSLPEIESQRISEKTKTGIYFARKRGCYTSKAPFGYDNITINYNSTLVKNYKATIIQQAFSMLNSENKSLKEVKKFFKSNGYNKGYNDLKTIISNRVYLGEILVPAHNGQPEKYIKGLHEPLISHDLFEKANEYLKKYWGNN